MVVVVDGKKVEGWHSKKKFIHSILMVASRCQAWLEPEQYLTRCGCRHVCRHMSTYTLRVDFFCSRVDFFLTDHPILRLSYDLKKNGWKSGSYPYHESVFFLCVHVTMRSVRRRCRYRFLSQLSWCKNAPRTLGKQTRVLSRTTHTNGEPL